MCVSLKIVLPRNSQLRCQLGSWLDTRQLTMATSSKHLVARSLGSLTTALLTAEAGYRSSADATQQAISLKLLLSDVSHNLERPLPILTTTNILTEPLCMPTVPMTGNLLARNGLLDQNLGSSATWLALIRQLDINL